MPTANHWDKQNGWRGVLIREERQWTWVWDAYEKSRCVQWALQVCILGRDANLES